MFLTKIGLVFFLTGVIDALAGATYLIFSFHERMMSGLVLVLVGLLIMMLGRSCLRGARKSRSFALTEYRDLVRPNPFVTSVPPGERPTKANYEFFEK